jgi:protein CWC15
MTSAARPTFDPARGRATISLTGQYASRDLNAHTKIKYRQPGQGGDVDGEPSELDLREELRRREAEHYESKRGKATLSIGDKERLEELAKLSALDAPDNDDDDSEGGSGSSSEEEDDDEDDDDDDSDDDDDAELLRELEKIRQERAEEKEREEKVRQQAEEERVQEQASLGNPLLRPQGKVGDFTVKRRWDDDVIFKNQSRGVDDKAPKRFVNDTLRSDFHRKFMHKYIR